MDSPYSQYLNTNYAPTTDDARGIQAIIDNSAAEILGLDEQIYKLQKQLNVLQDRKTKVHAFSEQHKALLSPIRQLNRDILEEIFLACFSTKRNPCISTTEAPMLLTHICSSWRQIALSTPRMWAKIHISLPVMKACYSFVEERDVIEQERRVLRILNILEGVVNGWIGRAYSCPLSISIYQPRFSWGPSTPNIYSKHCEEIRKSHESFLENTIIPRCEKWRDLDIFVSDDTMRGILDTGIDAKRLPSLETLHVTYEMTRRLPLPPVHWKNVIALMSSRTTAATFNSCSVQDSDIKCIYPHVWGNLTELNLELFQDTQTSSVNVVQFSASVLRHCHLLRSLKLAMWTSKIVDSEQGQHSEDITLQYLTDLSITLPLTATGLEFAKSIQFPSLNHFNVQFNPHWHGMDFHVPPQNILKSLLRSSGDSVASLKICTPFEWAVSHDIVQILQLTPSLRQLSISSSGVQIDRWPSSSGRYQPTRMDYSRAVNDSLLQTLTVTGNTDIDIICPRLEELEVDRHIKTPITVTCLKEFVMSRKNDTRVSPLRRISLFINELKVDQLQGAQTVSMGNDSSIYFRKVDHPSYSPFGGFDDSDSEVDTDSFSSAESYNEL